MAEARNLLATRRVDVLFCDIQMPGENGIDFLRSIDMSKYHVVFVTAYNEYALQAIKAKAFDYLLKPLDVEELKNTAAALCVSVAEKRKHAGLGETYKDALLQLMGELKEMQGQSGKMAIHHASGILFVNIGDIRYLEGDGAYTVVHLENDKKIMATRALGEFEEWLSPQYFFRIHKSIVVNLQYVTEYSRADGFYVVTENGKQLPVGRRRVTEVLERLKGLAKNI